MFLRDTEVSEDGKSSIKNLQEPKYILPTHPVLLDPWNVFEIPSVDVTQSY